jgi:hypothetical protein
VRIRRDARDPVAVTEADPRDVRLLLLGFHDGRVRVRGRVRPRRHLHERMRGHRAQIPASVTEADAHRIDANQITDAKSQP